MNGNADGLMIYGKGASNQVRLYSNTTERLRVDSTGVDVTGTLGVSGVTTLSSTSQFVGNVGIGDIAGAAGGKLLFVDAADGTADNNDVARFRNQEATAGRNYGVSIIAGSNSTDNSLHVMDKSSNSSLIVKGDGRVGIGTASPSTSR